MILLVRQVPIEKLINTSLLRVSTMICWEELSNLTGSEEIKRRKKTGLIKTIGWMLRNLDFNWKMKIPEGSMTWIEKKNK